MSLNRYAARTDANQRAIIDALEAIGCLVYVIRQPVDLLIGLDGVWVPAEVKDGAKPPSRQKLRKTQAELMKCASSLRLPALTLTSPEQAVAAVRQAVATAEWNAA